MGAVSFHVDSAERSGRAEVLAFTAADAALLVNNRYEDVLAVCRRMFYHLNGVCRTVLGARSAVVTVGDRDTVLFYPHGVTDMNEWFVFLSYSLNSARRANL